jgi:hypothetical protein
MFSRCSAMTVIKQRLNLVYVLIKRLEKISLLLYSFGASKGCEPFPRKESQ